MLHRKRLFSVSCRFILYYSLLLCSGATWAEVIQPHRLQAPSKSDNHKGFPFVQNFNPKDYLHLTPSFEHAAILQDNKGRMLIGSHGGVLVYNGSDWQLVETPGKSMVWSLDKDVTGRVYVGATDNLGYLSADKKGKTVFTSLLPHLPKNMPPVGEVWSSIVTPEGVYFKSNQFLMRWHKGQFNVWKTETVFGAIQWIDGALHVHQPNKGLFVVRGGELEASSTSKFFAQSLISFLQPVEKGKWLVGLHGNKLVYVQGETITPVNKLLQSFLDKNTLFQSKLLPDGNIALTTLKGGVVIIDQASNIKTIINKESGLAANTTYSLGLDNQGGLWIGMEKGLSRIQMGSAFSYFNERNGLIRQTYALTEHQGILLAGTTDGLFELKGKTTLSSAAEFQKITGFPSSIWNFQAFGESLLVSSEAGLFEWRKGKFTPIPISSAVWDNYAYDVQRSSLDSSVVFVASKGLHMVRKERGHWKNLGQLPGLEENLNQILETPSGDLWLPVKAGVVRVQFYKKAGKNTSEDFLKNAKVTQYTSAKGMPSGAVKLFMVGKELIAQVGEGKFRLFSFQEGKGRFEPVPNYEKQFGLKGESILPAMEYSTADRVWLWSRDRNEQAWNLKLAQKQGQGSYAVQTFYLSGLTSSLKSAAFEDKNGTLWFAGVDGLVRFDLSAHKEPKQPFQTLLEQILVSGDSVIYPQAGNSPKLSFKNNSLRFEVAAPSYNGTGENKFKYWLEGYEENWSAWTKEPFKEYTQIPEGRYTLHVKGINPQGILGKEAQYAFVITPPWYRTGVMYFIYLIFAGGAIYALIRWRHSELEAEKAYLEQVVYSRTDELAAKNNQLKMQTEELANQTEKLKELDQVKSRFFANISHEFRTPLTIILNNLLDHLSVKAPASEEAHVPVKVTELKVMSRNARRLLQLINQLLDLSKVESGKMPLELKDGDLKQLLTIVHASFSSLAEHQQKQFRLLVPQEPLLCQYDEDKVEKILYNLLSNAFKFTPANGEVRLKAEFLKKGENQDKAVVRIEVQDTGPGLAPDQAEKVFDRFYQGKQYYSDAQGTGIGLALAKDLVEVHQGQIWVGSEPSQGTKFIVELPFVPVSSAPPSAYPYIHPDLLVDLEEPQRNEIAAHQEMQVFSQTEQETVPLVLLVEDNKDLRTYLRTTLEAKFKVLESINGVEGLAKAQEVVPDLIISDWMMPQMDGIELCGHLKTDVRTSHIPVILLTALATTDAKLTGLETGADDYLTKPFDSKELHARINNLIENRRKLREHFSKEIRLEPTKMVVASVDEKFLRQAMQVVEDRMGDAEFTVDEFSREIGLSRVHLHRKLKELTGQSPSDFIRVLRLKQAAHLLESRAGNIAEIAYQVGFNNLSYFSKCFREKFGCLPNEYAAQQLTPSA